MPAWRRLYLPWFLAAPLLGACSGQVVVIEVAGSPKPTASLEVHALLDGALSPDEPQLPIDSERKLTLGLRLPIGATGHLTVTVAALDSAGCLIASGDAEVELPSWDSPTKVELEPLPSAACNLVRPGPNLLGVTPNQMFAAKLLRSPADTTMTIDGWGFEPGVTASVGNIPQETKLLSYRRLAVTDPRLPIVPGPAQVKVGGGEGRTDLFSVNLTSFEPLSIRGLEGSITPSTLDFAVADLDHDGSQDVVTLDTGGRVQIFRNVLGLTSDSAMNWQRAGAFQVWLDPFPWSAGSIVAADVDNDQLPDLVVVSSVGTAVFLNKGGFSFALTGPPLAAAGSSAELLPMRPGQSVDLVVLDPKGAVTIHPHTGTSAFAKDPTWQDVGPSQAMAAADLNNDGWTDLVLTAGPGSPQSGGQRPMPGVVRVLLADQHGSFREEQYRILACDPGFSSTGPLIIADLNQDSRPDITTNGTSILLLNTGTEPGRLFTQQPIDRASACLGGEAVAVADVNADGLPDLLQLGDRSLTVMFQLDGARFTADPSAHCDPSRNICLVKQIMNLTLPTALRRLPMVDMDGDGQKDIVLGTDILLVKSMLPLPR